MATKSGSNKAADQEFDPKYEWQENAANFMLRLHLAGFRKEDFRVQVDGAGRLTVRGQRADGGKHVRFHKVFQLPPTSNLDDISGRFDAGVLSITVPKRPPAQAPPSASTSTTVDDIVGKPTKQDKNEAKPKEDKTPPQVERNEDEAKKKKTDEKKPEESKKKPEEQSKGEETHPRKPKAAADDQKTKAEQPQKTTVRNEEEANKPKQAVDGAPESLLERVRRRTEEEEASAQRQRNQQSACRGGWKERVAEELQGLKTSDWAEGVVDTVKNNRELIAAAVAAFSLGLFVSGRLFSRN